MPFTPTCNSTSQLGRASIGDSCLTPKQSEVALLEQDLPSPPSGLIRLSVRPGKKAAWEIAAQRSGHGLTARGVILPMASSSH